MKKLYVCRGLPGAGKSTYARTLAPLVVEPDMFRYNADNEYVFDSDRNAEVNRKTFDLCAYAMYNLELPVIAVTAVFTKLEHFLPYVRMARRHGYVVTVVECKDKYKNVHNVPDNAIAQMKDRWEPFDEELANQEGVSLWHVIHGHACVMYAPKTENRHG